MLSDFQDYSIIKCSFSASSKEKAVVKKAIVASDNLSVVYNKKNYNICESPVTLENDNSCDFYLYIFVKDNDYLAKLSQEEKENYIASNLKITLQ